MDDVTQQIVMIMSSGEGMPSSGLVLEQLHCIRTIYMLQEIQDEHSMASGTNQTNWTPLHGTHIDHCLYAVWTSLYISRMQSVTLHKVTDMFNVYSVFNICVFDVLVMYCIPALSSPPSIMCCTHALSSPPSIMYCIPALSSPPSIMCCIPALSRQIQNYGALSIYSDASTDGK